MKILSYTPARTVQLLTPIFAAQCVNAERGALCHYILPDCVEICGACRLALSSLDLTRLGVTDGVTCLSDAPCEYCGATLNDRANMSPHDAMMLALLMRAALD